MKKIFLALSLFIALVIPVSSFAYEHYQITKVNQLVANLNIGNPILKRFDEFCCPSGWQFDWLFIGDCFYLTSGPFAGQYQCYKNDVCQTTSCKMECNVICPNPYTPSSCHTPTSCYITNIGECYPLCESVWKF